MHDPRISEPQEDSRCRVGEVLERRREDEAEDFVIGSEPQRRICSEGEEVHVVMIVIIMMMMMMMVVVMVMLMTMTTTMLTVNT